jgi:hypothetical protein
MCRVNMRWRDWYAAFIYRRPVTPLEETKLARIAVELGYALRTWSFGDAEIYAFALPQADEGEALYDRVRQRVPHDELEAAAPHEWAQAIPVVGERGQVVSVRAGAVRIVLVEGQKMSQNRIIQLTQLRDRECLRRALQDLEAPFEEAQAGQTVMLRGYYRSEPVDFVVRKQHAGLHYGDVGWRWNEGAGCFDEVADHLEEKRVTQFRQVLLQRYGVHEAVKRVRKLGFKVVSERIEGGQVHIHVRRWQ